MDRLRDTASISRAWAQALRAAALLLNAEVGRQVRARRAGLSEAQRDQLDETSQQAWSEAFGLYPPEVWERFEIDEPELRRRAVDVARLRMAGRIAEAAEAEREALRRS